MPRHERNERHESPDKQILLHLLCLSFPHGGLKMGWRDYQIPVAHNRENLDELTGGLEGLDEEQRFTFEERAAIMEYDGGLPREEAERAASDRPFQNTRTISNHGGK
jgi:hypothetical protein